MTSAETHLQSGTQGFLHPDIRTNSLYVGHVLKHRKNDQAIRFAKEGAIGKVSLLENVYTTVGGETVTLEVTPSTEGMFGAKPLDRKLLGVLQRTLTDRQHPYIPEAGEEEHLSTVLFLSKNWEKLMRNFYLFGIKGSIQPVSFTEVVLNDNNNHRADVVGLGPDGRVFIIEVGRRSKSSQVQGYIDSFRELFEDRVSATPLVAYYSSTPHGRTIHVKPPFTPRLEKTDKALEYIHELAGRGLNPPPSWK